MQYHALLSQLLGGEKNTKLFELIAIFFASQFFCMNNVPRPLALSYFGTAFSYCIDAGFHR